jgi:hypothetical protein
MKRIKDQCSKLGKDYFILYYLGGCQGVRGERGERRGEEREKGERKALFELLLMSLESFPRIQPSLGVWALLCSKPNIKGACGLVGI